MRRLALLSLLALTCKSPVDPNQGRFSCTTSNDCGGGYECVTQFAGGGFCFENGKCVLEECNGKDDNCDGRIDETFASMTDVCQTGAPGPCGTGRNVCSDGGVRCVSVYSPIAETCNGIDDDCANGVDDGFNLASDNSNCGSCGRTCATGSQCVASLCRETNCSDGIDNDDGGTADCLDAFCLGVGCGLDGGFNCGVVLVQNDAGTVDAGITDAGPDDGGMMMDAGLDDGGSDAGAFDGGPGPSDAGFTAVLACVPREFPCNNGVDDDLDGELDCADPDCNAQACDGGTCMMGSCR